MKELNLNEVALVSGGGNAGDRDTRFTRGAPATSANNAGVGIIVGTLAALATVSTGPVGMVVAGAMAGGIASALPSGSGNSNRGGWHDINPGGMVGQCRW